MSARRRQSRATRKAGVKVRLTARDRDLLLALARLRIMRTSDAGRLSFAGISRQVVAARLRLLYDAHFLEVHSPDKAAENVYSLGERGRQLVRAAGLPVGRVPRPPYEHHLGIVRMWTTLSRLSGDWRLSRAVPDWELRERFPSLHALVPDLFALLSDGEVTIAAAFEIDRGTEALRLLRRKVAAYAELLREGGLYGWREFGLCFELHSDQRVTAVRDLLVREWPNWFLLWRAGEDLNRPLSQLPSPAATASRYGSRNTEDIDDEFPVDGRGRQ